MNHHQKILTLIYELHLIDRKHEPYVEYIFH